MPNTATKDFYESPGEPAKGGEKKPKHEKEDGFITIKNAFYESISNAIENRKKTLKLKRENILWEETRVSKIVTTVRNKHYPYLIAKGEYPYLYCLFLYQDHDSFIKGKISEAPEDDLIKKNGSNYDEMLWEHVDWKKIFEDVIAILSSEPDNEPDNLEDLKKTFEDTLVDYVPYAAIRNDGLHKQYAKTWIPDSERKEIRQKAIEWVHLRHGSKLFKQTFYEKFSGKTLQDFDKGFHGFIADYLQKRKPKQYSLGLQAYELHKNISGYAAYWQDLPSVRYGDGSTQKSKLEKLLNEYRNNGDRQIRKLERYQQKFDALHITVTDHFAE